MKLKHLLTGNVKDMQLLPPVNGEIRALGFWNGRWNHVLVQRLNAETDTTDTFWVPAEEGTDY